MKNKKIVFIIAGIAVLAVAVCVTLLNVFPKTLSEKKIQKLREQYPLASGSSTAEIAGPVALSKVVEISDNYAVVTVQKQLSDTSVVTGVDKEGTETGTTFKNYQVHVDEVIYGDSSLAGTDITLTINSLLPIPSMDAGTKLVIPLGTGEEGKYGLSIMGTYYVAGGYVLSTMTEDSSVSTYSGVRLKDLKKSIVEYKNAK